MTDQNETPEFRPVGDEWEPCKEPDGAPLEFRKLRGQWWKHCDGWHVLAVQDGCQVRLVACEGGLRVLCAGPEWNRGQEVLAFGAASLMQTVMYTWLEPAAEQRRVQALRELPDIVMQRIAEARHKHPEPQSIGRHHGALQREVTEVIHAAFSVEGADRIRDALLGVIVIASRALSEEWAS